MPWTNQTAQQLHLDLGQLNGIINATHEHQAEMQRLNNSVGGQVAPNIAQSMASDAGRIMQQRLNEWYADFGKITADLQALNDRVTWVRDALIQSNIGASGSATGGR